MLFLTEADMLELTEKAGIVKFPLVNPTYEDLCYISCWVGMRKELPGSIHNMMVLGEANTWTKIYLNNLETKRIGTNVDPSEKLFYLAS